MLRVSERAELQRRLQAVQGHVHRRQEHQRQRAGFYQESQLHHLR